MLSQLAHNALVHAPPADDAPAQMSVRLAVTEVESLVIDIQDPRLDLPLAKAGRAGERGRGLKYTRLLGATVSCLLHEDTQSKTVRAQLAPGGASL